MNLTWVDFHNIAMELVEKFPETDPKTVRFTDLHQWVLELENFSDDPNQSNEKILETIILCWMDERN
ncbi:Fe-S cluster assembly protein IscX [Candidatus Enterovibrio altilux]|nr:Fe-S cluster assembly protein IscX [Candidatus Enterovibrio luxaltus]